MRKYILAFAAALLAVGVYAQVNNPGTGVTIADVLPLLPTPATTVPQTEAVGGALGSNTSQFMRADAKLPRITRASTVATDASGNWAVTWSSALSATPVVLPIPINASGQPVVCNVSTTSASGATGTCSLARTLPATLTLLTALVSYSVFQIPATGTQVQVLAIPPTQ